jgi:hypothetical protein
LAKIQLPYIFVVSGLEIQGYHNSFVKSSQSVPWHEREALLIPANVDCISGDLGMWRRRGSGKDGEQAADALTDITSPSLSPPI